MRKNRKMKTILLTLALGLTLAGAATAVGCDKKGGGGGDPFTSEQTMASVRFENSYVEVKQYATQDLGCTVKGTTSEVTFTSSDNALVTVDASGVVTTYGEMGEATITATVDGVSATCVVKVIKTEIAPVIVLNATEYNIEKGETLEFSVATEWNHAEYTEPVEYAVSFAEDSQNAVSQISVEGDSVKVVAGDVEEEFDVIISATVRDIYTSAKVTVKVLPQKLALRPASMDFVPNTSGNYETQLYSTDALNTEEVTYSTSVDLDFVAMLGAEQVDADVVWTVAGDAAVVEDGVLKAKKKGSVVVTGTATYEGSSVEISLTCDVLAPRAHLNQKVQIEVADLKLITLQETLVGNIQTVELFGKEVGYPIGNKMIGFTNYAPEDTEKENPLFPTSAHELGEQQLLIKTDLVDYTMDATVYTMIINNAEELQMMRTVADTGAVEYNNRSGYEGWHSSQIYDGYFVLGNDITWDLPDDDPFVSMTDVGSVWWCQGVSFDLARGFKGVFDGQGYNIDNLTIGLKHPSGDAKQSGGMFGYISKEGIVRNVSFTNATLCANSGFICSVGDGTIENVSISYKKLGGDRPTNGLDGIDPSRMGSFFSRKAGANATVKNCLVDASAAEITEETGWYNGKRVHNIKLVGQAQNVENVIAICPNQTVLENSGATIKKLNYVALMEDESASDGFDESIWTTVENVLMFKNQALNLNRDAEVGFLPMKNALVAGFEMLVLPSNPYVSIELEAVEGVTFEDSLLKATEKAFGQTVKLTVKSLFNPNITAEHSVYIDSFGAWVKTPDYPEENLTIYSPSNVLEIGDGEWMGDENYVYIGADIISIGKGEEQLEIDLSKLVWGAQPVTVVIVKDGERTHFDVSLTKWYETADFEDSTVVEDSAFNLNFRSEQYSFTQHESDIETPENYTKVTKLTCDKVWPTAVDRNLFTGSDLSAYSDLWFGVRIANGRFIAQQATVETAGWVFFHYTQTADNVWSAEVTVGGMVEKVEHDISGWKLSEMLYRSGWNDGFLWYNNNAGVVDANNPTTIYATELRGVRK